LLVNIECGKLYVSKKAMPTYNEVLKQAQSLSIIDQFQLLKDLQKIVSQGVEVEGTDEVIPADEIAESEAALADYLAGRDLDFPENWATTQHNLGFAYSDKITGKRAENIDMAIACYQQALEVYTRQDFPEDWAMTQNNLGSA
jgi:hypothetical protein